MLKLELETLKLEFELATIELDLHKYKVRARDSRDRVPQR